MVGLLVHEWIAPTGGSENVLEALAEAFPGSDVWALWNDDRNRFPQARESWLSRTPLRRSRVAALPLMPAVWRTIPATRDYDWVLASSHLFAHHASIDGQPDLPKMAYVHTPARYIWSPEIDERGQNPLARLASPALRALDKARAAEITSVAANSQFVSDRIARAWGVEARVIYPPVDTERITAVGDWGEQLNATDEAVRAGLPDAYVLGASRFVTYKRLDAAIRVGEMLDLPVVLAGAGPDEERLRALADQARVPVLFVNAPSDALLFALYQRAALYVFMAIEDFGIMPVEAMACGTPVLVGAVGGAAESVERCEGGAVLPDLAGDTVRAAVDGLARIDRVGLRRRATAFSRERFGAEVRAWVSQVVSSDG